MKKLIVLLAFFVVAGCTVQLYPPPQVTNLPDGGKIDILPDSVPAEYSSRPRFYWEQIEKSDSTQSFAVTNGSKDGRWVRGDSMRWIPAGPFIKIMSDTVATRAYSRSILDRNGIFSAANSGSRLPSGGMTVYHNGGTFSILDSASASGLYMDIDDFIWGGYDATKRYRVNFDITAGVPSTSYVDLTSLEGSMGVRNDDGAFISSSSMYFQSKSGQTDLQIRTGSSDFVISDLSTDGQKGLKYAADYSASYDSRTLPDVAWVRSEISDSVAAAGGGTMSSFNLAADSGTPETVTNAETVTTAGGYGINTSIAATNTTTIEVDTTQVATQYDLTQITGTDNQTVDTFSISGNVVTLALEGDNESPYTLNIQESVEDAVNTLVSGQGGITTAYDDFFGTLIIRRADADYGDITISSSGSVMSIDAGAVGPDELASTAVTPGAYTHASITVDADGRVTAASSGTDATGMVTFDVIGDVGTAETIQDADELYLRGQFGINTSNSATDIINFNVDSSEVATVYALQDTAATLRALITGLDTLANYTALRAYTGAGNAVYVQNQGLFIRGASGSENGGTVIVATNSVVWKRFFDGCTYYPEFWEDGGYDETGSAAGITDTTEMIQAAINLANTNGGGEVRLKPGITYNVIAKAVNPTFGGSHKYCVEIKSNVNFVISRGAILRKANGAQTDAGGAVDVLFGKCVSDASITGGGVIDGNAAGQTGWTGGYSQAGVNGSGIYFSRQTGDVICNYGLVVNDITIKNNFSTAIDLTHFDRVAVKNVRSESNGEGIEFILGNSLVVENVEISDSNNVAVGDGLELSAVNNYKVSGVYAHTNGDGTAIDVYASSFGTISNFTLNGFGGGGISVGTNANGDYSDRVVISDGVIRNYPGGGAGGIYPGDGMIKIKNVVFDSVNLGVNFSVPSVPAGYINEVDISGCSFRNNSGGTGIFTRGERKINIASNDFSRIGIGIQNSYDAAGDPIMKIIGNTFDSTYTHNILFDAQGQSYPTYNPVAYIENNNFTHQLGTKGINGIGTYQNIFVRDNVSDPWPALNGGTVDVKGLEEIIKGTSGTLTSVTGGANGQILRINAANLAAYNGININDPRNSGGGNIYLKDGDQANLATGDVVTIKYDMANNKWHEVSRGQSGNFFGSGKPIGSNRMIIDGWHVTNVQDSMSNATIKRFGSSETLGNYFIGRRDMAVRKLCIYSNTSITTGSITAELWWNGAGPNATVVLNSSNPTNNTTDYGKFSKVISANNLIEIRYSTSNDFGHPTADIMIWLEVEY